LNATILVAGGTGLLGSAIASRLLDAGRHVRILTRDASRAAALIRKGAEVATGDLTDAASLRPACADTTHVVTTANAFVNPGSRAVTAVDEEGNRHLIDAAREAGVRRFVFTSALIPEAYTRVDYFAAKRHTEDYLRSSGLTYTILRPAAFMEIWARIIGEPIMRTGSTRIFGDGRNPMNFVAIDDVAAIAVEALDDPRAVNATIDIVGPDNLTLLQVAEVFERIRGRPARKRRVPVPVMRILSPLMRPFNPVFARQVALGVLVATTPQSADPVSRQMWAVPMTTLEAWARHRYGSQR
jgi:uncharacterized protein YbjT (DUF2867 family)